MDTITFIGLALIFLGGVGAILLSIGQSRSSFKDKTEIIDTLKQEVSELKTERDKLNASLEERDKKIQEQNSKVESLSNKLVEKSEYIEKYISGGDSYPLIEMGELINTEDGSSKISFMLRNPFELPIYDIIVEMYDYDEFQLKTFMLGDGNDKAIKLKDYVEARIVNFQKNLLSPKSWDMSLGTFPLKTYNLYTKIHTRNKSFIQKIAIINYKNHYYSGFAIYDLIEKRIVFENYNSNNPSVVQNELKEKVKNIPNNITHYIFE